MSLLLVRTTLRSGLPAGVGIGLGSLSCVLLLAGATALAGRSVGARGVRRVDIVAGVGLIGFGVALGVRVLS